MLTKMDIVLMYTVFLALVDKGLKKDSLITEDEKHRLSEVIKLNNIDNDLETIILSEIFNELLIKTGVRFGTVSQLVN